MRKNEHPGCSCRMCQRGLRRPFGKFLVSQTQRKIRRAYKLALRSGDDVVQIIVSTPYTD
jgi:hypothetical protein